VDKNEYTIFKRSNTLLTHLCQEHVLNHHPDEAMLPTHYISKLIDYSFYEELIEKMKLLVFLISEKNIN
jgi:hypothetical protein